MEKIRIYQTDFTNKLLQFDSRNTEYRTIGFAVNERYYEVNNQIDVFVKFEPSYKGKLTLDDFQFSLTTHRLLVYLIERFTAVGNGFEFTVKEFMERCGLKDRDNTKRLIEKDLFSLLCIRAEYNGREFFILETFEIGRGRFYVELHEALCEELTAHKSYLYITDDWYKIDLHRFPQAPGLLYHMIYLSHTNSKRTNKNRVGVNSLLVRGKFPTEEEVRQTSNNSIRERIQHPFFRTMDIVSQIVSIEYYNKAGRQLSIKEVKALSYNELVKLVIHYEALI